MRKTRNLLMFAVCGILLTGCGKQMTTNNQYPDAKVINLNGDTASIGTEQIEEYDYTWHCDPSVSHDEVDNAPAEYYTGTTPDNDSVCYIDHDLKYFPEVDVDGFKVVNYDGENEWAYYYNDGENNDYIWATLPHLTNELPTDMMHSEDEASKNKVLHITEPGEYILQGIWDGQILVDLGEDASEDENSKVTLILDNADIECSVAPGIIFKNVYECDAAWEDRSEYDVNVDTSAAGANIIIADNSENTVSGQNVFRMLKTKYKNDDDTSEIKVQKKNRKTDGALYSYMTMNIYGGNAGDGKLNVSSNYEGVDSELHLSVYGGDITINSQDDGMNVNEDNVSVIAFYGGNLTINAALGAEGDGVDSNGFIKVDGATISVNGIRVPDNALDSEDGVYYISGKIIIDGEEQQLESDSVTQEIGGKNMGQPPQGTNGDMENPPERPDGEIGNPPERPDGEIGNPPERPDGDMGNPPEKPDGDIGNPPEKPEQTTETTN